MKGTLMSPENNSSYPLQDFALLGLRNIKIRHRLVISCLISTVIPLICILLYSYYLYGNTEITGQTLAIGILMLCGSLTMTSYTYLSIAHPVEHMIQSCQSISEGNLDVRIQDKGSDELAYLSDNIDGMVTEIQLLLEQQKDNEAKKRELELKMLQYQINPHFLFNTLNTLQAGIYHNSGRDRQSETLFFHTGDPLCRKFSCNL
jgi:sensor histidine kinase YesM